jgi:hypothetical protein
LDWQTWIAHAFQDIWLKAIVSAAALVRSLGCTDHLAANQAAADIVALLTDVPPRPFEQGLSS